MSPQFLRRRRAGAADTGLSYEQLRRYGEAVLGGVRIPEPFDVDALCANVQEQRDRPLRLQPLTGGLRVDGLCGLAAAGVKRDYLFYSRYAGPTLRTATVCHEVGHVLCGHLEDPVEDPAASGWRAQLFAAADAEGDFAGDDTIRRVFGRACYSGPQEQQAEIVALLLVERAARAPRREVAASTSTTDVAQVLQRLSATLGARAD